MFFFNDKYKILNIIIKNSVKIFDNYYSSISQDEISKIGNFSKTKVNRSIKELIKKNIIKYNPHKNSTYIVEEKIIKIIDTLNEMEERLSNVKIWYSKS